MITIPVLLSAAIMYLLPLLTGRTVMRQLFRRQLTYPLVSYFVIGELILTTLVITLNYFIQWLMPFMSFPLVLKAIVFALIFTVIPFNLKLPYLKIKNYLFPLLFAGIIVFAAFSLWQFNSQYPFNWDIYEHQTLINEMLKGRFSLMPSQISDTFGFNSYSIAPYISLASSQVFFDAPIFDYWNVITIIHFTLIVLAAYFFTREITENKTVAFISMLLGAFIFDSNMSYTTLFFIPQTFTAMVFMYLLIQLISEAKKGRIMPVWLIAVGVLFLFFNHYVIGVLAAGIYLLTYVYFKYREFIIAHLNRRLLVEVGLFIGFLTILLSPQISLGFLNFGEAQSFTSDLTEKFTIMKQNYGFLLLLFLPIGIASTLRRNREIEIVSLVSMAGIVILLLLQLPYMMKFYVLGRMFVHLFMAVGIYAIIKQIKNPSLYLGAYIFLIVALISVFISNASIWKGYLRYRDVFAQISPLELKAAIFLKETYGSSDAFLISDPATQYILEAFSHINTQGGAYMKSKTRNILNEVYQTSSAKVVAEKLYQIDDAINPTDGKRLFALSGRYFAWQDSGIKNKYSLVYNIWSPVDMTFNNYKEIEEFKADREHFKQVFENPAIVIFEVQK